MVICEYGYGSSTVASLHIETRNRIYETCQSPSCAYTHPASVRSVAFSPSLWQPLQAIVGLDNGSIYRYSILVVIKPVSTPNVRWDLKMGQRGLLDRLLVAHTTPVTSLSWRESPGINGSETGDNGMGWFASGGLDRCVKVNRCIRTSCHLLSTHIGMGSKCTGL
jgi:hypothetical protein